MTTILLAVPLFMLAVFGLALGVAFGHRSIKGSCGGCTDCIDRRDKP